MEEGEEVEVVLSQPGQQEVEQEGMGRRGTQVWVQFEGETLG